MNNTTENGKIGEIAAICGFRLPAMGSVVGATKDAGRVRLGGFGPAFRLPQESRATADAGSVRVGGFGPLFR